jgi:hypothetical protein
MKTKCILLIVTFILFPGIQFVSAQTLNSSRENLPVSAGKYNDSSFGENAFVFEQGMDMKEIQNLIDSIYILQSSKGSEFNKKRFVLFFKPGTYNLDIKVGYYMQILGLGESPDDVVIVGAVRSKSIWGGHVLSNFWRSAENLTVIPTIDSCNIWGVSQAAPLRRVHIKGSLQLHDNGYASGGFMADSKIDGTVYSGQQQQWFSRNIDIGKWVGYAWNMVFVGVQNAPSGNWPDIPYTVIKETPVIREKPYFVYTKKGFYVKIPKLKKNTVGPGWLNDIKDDNALRLDEFYLVKPGIDNSESINAVLKKGKNLIFTPGIYPLDKCLNVTHPGTVIIGIGMPSLVPTNGNSVMEVSDVDGVTVSGLLIDAGAVHSETLFQVGEPGSRKSHESNPSFLFDIFFRVGGPAEGSTASCMVINSDKVYVDHTWLWRADHGNGVGWGKNRCANGLIVNGDRVTVYGLFNEHFQEYQTIWNGNNGRVYLYQSEMPYDPPTADMWKHDGVNGWASYKVSDNVTSHEAWGVGVYSYFPKTPVIVDNAIETPVSLEKNIHHSFTFWLGGNKESIIKSIINGKGDSVNVSNRKATLD